MVFAICNQSINQKSLDYVKISLFDLLILILTNYFSLPFRRTSGCEKKTIITIRDLGVTVVTRDFSWIIKHGKIQFKLKTF